MDEIFVVYLYALLIAASEFAGERVDGRGSKGASERASEFCESVSRREKERVSA